MSHNEHALSMEAYCPPLTKQVDFDAFWVESHQQVLEQPLRGTCTAIEYPISTTLVMDICYCGSNETPIHDYLSAARLGSAG